VQPKVRLKPNDTRNSSGDEIFPNVTSFCFATPLAFNAPRWRGSPGTISVKFYTKVKGWLRYKMVKKYCRMFQPLSRAQWCMNVTDDRRICDSKDANVTSSYSGKMLLLFYNKIML